MIYGRNGPLGMAINVSNAAVAGTCVHLSCAVDETYAIYYYLKFTQKKERTQSATNGNLWKKWYRVYS